MRENNLESQLLESQLPSVGIIEGMDGIDILNEDLSLTFKFGGYWREISNKNRRIYEGGKQKILKLKKDMIKFDVLTKETELICPWLKGHCFELYYHVNGTSPKVYKLITGDEEVLQILDCLITYVSSNAEIQDLSWRLQNFGSVADISISAPESGCPVPATQLLLNVKFGRTKHQRRPVVDLNGEGKVAATI